MAYVIAEPCIGTKDTACVDACPVDCIHPKKDEPDFETSELLYIDPVECIDCGACVPACPVEAIYAEPDVPAGMEKYVALNAELSNDWPGISRTHEPLPDADHWAGVKDKFAELQRHP